MQAFAKRIKAASSASGRLATIEALRNLTEFEIDMFNAVWSPWRKYGVRSWERPSPAPYDDANYHFVNLLYRLNTKQLVGNEAREAVTSTLSRYTASTIEVMEQIIHRRFGAGITPDAVKKANPGIVLERYEGVMACGKTDTSLSGVSFPCIVEEKLDGQRVTAFVKDGHVNYISRSGKPATFCEGLFDKEILASGYDVLDGEVMAPTFTETLNAKGKSGDKDSLRFFVFDVLTSEEWSDLSKVTQAVRSDRCNRIAVGKLVNPLRQTCNTPDDVLSFYRFITQRGGEGVIIKNPYAYYEKERSVSWLKMKPVITLDLQIIECFEGRERLEGTLGGFILAGHDENGNIIETRCGTGFSDELRASFWARRANLIGRTVEIEAQEVTQAADGSYSARFPVFIRIRNDK